MKWVRESFPGVEGLFNQNDRYNCWVERGGEERAEVPLVGARDSNRRSTRPSVRMRGGSVGVTAVRMRGGRGHGTKTGLAVNHGSDSEQRCEMRVTRGSSPSFSLPSVTLC